MKELTHYRLTITPPKKTKYKTYTKEIIAGEIGDLFFPTAKDAAGVWGTQSVTKTINWLRSKGNRVEVVKTVFEPRSSDRQDLEPFESTDESNYQNNWYAAMENDDED